jgi:uncharacterized membrane protein YeiH
VLYPGQPAPVARTQNMDLFGFAAMGLVSGLGGGIIRDVLLEHGTPAALVDPAYIPTALGGAAIAFLMHIRVAKPRASDNPPGS